MNNIKFARHGSVPFRRWCKHNKISKAVQTQFEDAVWNGFCHAVSQVLFLYLNKTIWIGGYFAGCDNPSFNKIVSGISHETLHAVLDKIGEHTASLALDNFVHGENVSRTGLHRR